MYQTQKAGTHSPAFLLIFISYCGTLHIVEWQKGHAMINNPKAVNVISASSRIKSDNLTITDSILSYANIPEGQPIVMEIYDGKIVVTYIPSITH